MTKTLLFGGSGFFGPVILSKDPNIISVGRTKPPSYCQNKHIHINDLDELNKLDSIEFDKVIFLIGSSNHHDININIDMGIDFNVYPLNKALFIETSPCPVKYALSKIGMCENILRLPLTCIEEKTKETENPKY